MACAFDSGGGDGSGDTRGTSSDADDDGETDAGSVDDATVTATAEGTETTSATDPSDTTSDDASSATTGSESDTDTPPEYGCPDQLPQDWIFCSDFDGDAPEAAFSAWEPGDDRMAIAAGEGLVRSSALEFRHEPGIVWSGRAAVHFGDTPRDGDTQYADEETLDEVWVRVFLRTEMGWPALGPGDLLSVDIEADDGEGTVAAVRASIYSPMIDEVLGVHPQRCFTGTDPGCGGGMSLGALEGATAVYGEPRAGEWQCIEMHVRVDDGGSNGQIELFVDEQLDAMRDDYAFVQGWSGNRWNSLQITGSWDGGPPQPLRRWIDDVVISRAPIGCG